ncbi:MAG: hypothetical protein K0Q70_1107 [Rhodospirillales bacterium]|nr:hypothetical protein [Rhodospirillales bacterium]
MSVMPALVFLLCVITSVTCAALLLRQYIYLKTRLLFWSFLCFVGLAINNGLVFVDLVVLGDDVSLLSYRHLASLAAVSVLLYGFIRESD